MKLILTQNEYEMLSVLERRKLPKNTRIQRKPTICQCGMSMYYKTTRCPVCLNPTRR